MLGVPGSGCPETSRVLGASRGRRTRDVLDILLIDLWGNLDYSKTAKAAIRIFQERATHAFPPAFTIPDEWRSELEAMAAELDLPIKQSREIGAIPGDHCQPSTSRKNGLTN